MMEHIEVKVIKKSIQVASERERPIEVSIARSEKSVVQSFNLSFEGAEALANRLLEIIDANKR